MSERERTREMYQTSHLTVARRLNKFPIAGKLTRATTTNIRNILSFSAKKKIIKRLNTRKLSHILENT